jgi:predicted  nucleic acid-binding Zn-ribbon protein
MNPQALEEKIVKIKTLETTIIRAEGALERHMADLQALGCSSIEEANTTLASLEVEISALNQQIDQATKELDGLTDWSQL